MGDAGNVLLFYVMDVHSRPDPLSGVDAHCPTGLEGLRRGEPRVECGRRQRPHRQW